MRLDHIIYLELIRFETILGKVFCQIQFFKAISRFRLFINLQKVFGDFAEEATPVPIPNTEVKLFRADDTAPARVWESRTLPELNKSLPIRRQAFFMN